MSLLKHSYRAYIPYGLAAVAAMLLSSLIWIPQFLLVPPHLTSIIDSTEAAVPIVLLIPIAFLCHDTYEVELSMTCGMPTPKLIFTKFLPILIYTEIVMAALALLYRYIPYDPDIHGAPFFPIHVPDDFRLYTVISTLVTTLFFASLFLFLRVVTHSNLLPLGAGLFFWVFFQTNNQHIRYGMTGLNRTLMDPFISSYFLGDTVPNRLGIPYMWTLNRLLFLALSVALLTATYLLLRRETLHRHIGE